MTHPPPLLLAIDTSTRYAGVALARGDVLLAEYTWQAGQNHTRQLIPVVRAVIQENAVTLGDIGLLAVAIGPGSFNGLRVGLATAKAFARTLGAPLIAAGTLEVEAYPHAAFPGPVCAIHDAGRGELAWATFTGDGPGGWRRLVSEQITQPGALARTIKRRTLVCGEPPRWGIDALKQQAAARLVFSSPSASVRRAADLAELAWVRHQAGEHAETETLQPLYLRRPPGGG